MVVAKQIPLPLAFDVVVVPRPSKTLQIVPHSPPPPAKPPPILIPQIERICKVCQCRKPLNRDHFHINKRRGKQVYYRGTCKVCFNNEARVQKVIAAQQRREQQRITVQKLKDAQHLVQQAWGDYQMAVDLFKKKIVTHVQFRKRKFKAFLEAQNVVLLVQAAQG